MIELAKALNQLQQELWGVKKGKANPFFNTKYADLQKVWETIREPLTKNGLSIVQLPCEAPPGTVGLRTIILHTSGESLEDKFFMPLKDATNPQAAGSAITYARRYALMGAVGIAPADDDGNEAAGKGESPEANAKAIQTAQKQIDKVYADFNVSPDLEAKKKFYLQMKALAGVDRNRVTKLLKEMSEDIMSRTVAEKAKQNGQ